MMSRYLWWRWQRGSDGDGAQDSKDDDEEHDNNHDNKKRCWWWVDLYNEHDINIYDDVTKRE